jgi:hypothetical protein
MVLDYLNKENTLTLYCIFISGEKGASYKDVEEKSKGRLMENKIKRSIAVLLNREIIIDTGRCSVRYTKSGPKWHNVYRVSDKMMKDVTEHLSERHDVYAYLESLEFNDNQKTSK